MAARTWRQKGEKVTDLCNFFVLARIVILNKLAEESGLRRQR
jgi:hypothetical protein